MKSKRQRILSMLENGTISTEEALTLLENLDQKPAPEAPQPTIEKEQPIFEEKPKEDTQQHKAERDNKEERKTTEDDEPSMDEFLEDLRKDFTTVGDRFMQFMQSAVQKVKEFDFESPFGQSYVFQHSISKPAVDVNELVIDVDHGKVSIHHSDDNEIRAQFTVKSFNSESEETAKETFLEKVLFVTDGNKLRLSSDMKMTKVDVDLYIPKKQYAKLSVRLINGAFYLNDTEIEQVRVKTANGKVAITGLVFKDAEFETANGTIDLNKVTGEKLEAETLNGRVYIDGHLVDVEAQSLSGHVVVTTTNENAKSIEAKTMSGSVEIYIPQGVPLTGEIASNMGKLDLQLKDVDRTAESEQLLQRSVRFNKDTESGQTPLHIFGEAKTGSVLVCYNAQH